MGSAMNGVRIYVPLNYSNSRWEHIRFGWEYPRTTYRALTPWLAL